MNRDQARVLIAQTFTQAFDKGRFGTFVVNVLNRIDESKAGAWNSQYIKDAFKDHVQRYERLGTYTSPDNEKLDVLIVYLTQASKLERARTAIRNFVADHLKARDEKEAAIVAFVSPTEKQWRFSYVKMDYASVASESGKVGVETRLTPARRFSYLVGEGESCHTAQTRFLALLQDTGTNPTLADIGEAFSVEAVTKEFFTKYAELFGEIHKSLERLVEKDKPTRDEFRKKGANTIDFAKKLMGQIVFLYFLQKKGWLGVPKGEDWGSGPHDFLRKLAAGAHGKYDNFFNDVLEPLFYDTLATDRGHEAWCNRFQCRIPFLNGGLFEPLADYDWRGTDVALPNKLFTNSVIVEEGITGTGVLDVFDRYNFTVNEAEPLENEVAIDPEMLGKVFENLIEENRRKGLGAYYTPREIVHYMCQESLINYLDSEINKAKESIPRADIETFVHLGEQISHYEAVQAKYAVRMPKSIEQHARNIDDQLADIRVCDPAVGSGAFPVGMMTEIVRARSALTPYFNDVHERTPYHFKRHAIQNCLYGVDIDAGAVEIARLRLWLSLVVDEEETKQIKPLPNLFYKIITGNSLIEVEKTLFNEKLFQQLEKLKPLYFDETITSKKVELRREIDDIIHQLTHGKETFDFHIYFSEVFHHKGGFDVVIANPPYGLLNKRQNKHESVVVSEPELQYYKSSPEYAPARGGMINVFRLFIVRSVNILREGGCCAEIFPLAFACDSSASELRKHLLDNHRIVGIEAFPERDNEKKRVFEAVKMSVCIMILQAKRKLESPFWLRIQRDRYVDTRGEKAFVGIDTIKTIDTANYTIPLLMKDELVLVESVYRTASPLASFGHCYTGEIDLTQDKSYLSQDGRHSVLIKGAIIDKYRIRDSMSQGEILFLNSRKYLENNHGKRTHHYKSERIVMQGITGVNEKTRLKMTLIGAGTFCANSVNYIIFKDSRVKPEYLLALLNSTLLNFVFSKTSTNSNVNGYEVDNLPIKMSDDQGQIRLAALATKILSAKRRNAAADTTSLEREVDTHVYDLYGFTQEQRAFVETRSAQRPGGESEPTIVATVVD
jgi:Alw26I/Eco31I/Esp3I family type II restriction m6 adenine DNA methyltransferase